MSPAACSDFEPQAAEFALGLLVGAARSDAVDHVTDCASCRLLADQLASVVDELVTLTPADEPPAGFEARVVAALTDAAERDEGAGAGRPAGRRRRPRRSRGPAGVAGSGLRVAAGTPPRDRGVRRGVVVVLVAAAVLVVGAVLFAGNRRGADPLLAGDMINRKGDSVGWVEVGSLAGNPAAGNAGADTVRVSLPAYGNNGERTYHLQVEWTTGGKKDLGEFTVGPGRQTWSVALGGQAENVRTIAVTNDEGTVICHAELG